MLYDLINKTDDDDRPYTIFVYCVTCCCFLSFVRVTFFIVQGVQDGEEDDIFTSIASATLGDIRPLTLVSIAIVKLPFIR